MYDNKPSWSNMFQLCSDQDTPVTHPSHFLGITRRGLLRIRVRLRVDPRLAAEKNTTAGVENEAKVEMDWNGWERLRKVEKGWERLIDSGWWIIGC